jgi:hypothetical protein
VTASDSAGPIPGYYDSPWPGEDGGPRRQQIGRGSTLAMRPGEKLGVTTRPAIMSCMPVLRGPGEVYVQGNNPPNTPATTGWVERVDPESLATITRSPDLPGGPFWPGGMLAHANGFLYVTYGRWCHKLDPDCALVASRELPRDYPYNSLLALSDGNLVMKNFVRDGSSRSYFTLLDPERLDPVGPEAEIPEGSIARISLDRDGSGEYVYVVGDHTIYRYRYDRAALARDESWSYRYRTRPDGVQSYGWDPVIAGGRAWFLDNGDNRYQQKLAGTGVASGALQLHSVSLADASDAVALEPFGDAGGTVVNPPLVDASRSIVVAYDSGNNRIAGFRYGGESYERLWQHDFGASCHFLLYPESGEIVVNDYRDGQEHAVVLDIESGEEKGRAAAGSPMQCVTFQSPGWQRDLYMCTFTTLARVFVQ